MERSPCWGADTLSHSDSLPSMEPVVSLPCLQNLTTGPCPEPYESNSHPQPLLLDIRNCLSPSGFAYKIEYIFHI
jgi:hypothetical protein